MIDLRHDAATTLTTTTRGCAQATSFSQHCMRWSNSGTKCNLILVSGTANQSRHEQHEVDLSVRRLLSSA